MTPNSFDTVLLKKKIIYKLPAQRLLGNALFAHIVKFLYNSSSQNGVVICSRAFRLRNSKSYLSFHQVFTNLQEYLHKIRDTADMNLFHTVTMVKCSAAEDDEPTILCVTLLPSKHKDDLFPLEYTNVVLPYYHSCAFPLHV